jgi:ParB-like chromosome segregation protein Spo0J
MLALAHHLQRAIDDGLVPDHAAIGRALGFTRPRVTQLLDLTLLAPDIQLHVLELEAVDGVEPVSERALRAVVRETDWQAQRVAWQRLLAARPRGENGALVSRRRGGRGGSAGAEGA